MGQAAPSNNVVSVLRADFNNPSVRQSLTAALPAHVSLEKFQRVVLTAVQSNVRAKRAP